MPLLDKKVELETAGQHGSRYTLARSGTAAKSETQ